ncbi:MAG: Spy/CpxP family protein refolding chaperone [Pseudomonadota bacterium]
MSSLSRTFVSSSPLLRTVAIAALLGTTMFFSPLNGARAESATGTPIQLAQAAAHKSADAKAATETKGETVEARITKLHADLKITADEQSKWDSVAQTMRDNAVSMEKLVATKRSQDPKSLTALDDLMNYQEFAQAHLAGLKDLTSSFKSLYDSMPDPQKKNADRVFQSFGRENAPKQG